MTVNHVEGENVGYIKLYALSTCGWCRKTRQLLDDMGVAYDYEYVDLLGAVERDKVVGEVKKWNPACSFPTMVINNKTCIVGFKEDEIRKAVGK